VIALGAPPGLLPPYAGHFGIAFLGAGEMGLMALPLLWVSTLGLGTSLGLMPPELSANGRSKSLPRRMKHASVGQSLARQCHGKGRGRLKSAPHRRVV